MQHALFFISFTLIYICIDLLLIVEHALTRLYCFCDSVYRRKICRLEYCQHTPLLTYLNRNAYTPQYERAPLCAVAGRHLLCLNSCTRVWGLKTKSTNTSFNKSKQSKKKLVNACCSARLVERVSFTVTSRHKAGACV